MTLRGAAYTAEWRATIARAAKVAGETQSDFIAPAAMTAAQRVLQGKPAHELEPAPLPVVQPELMARQDATDSAVAALAARVE